MLHGKSRTLSWYAESPYTRPINVGQMTPSSVLAINCKTYKEDDAMVMVSPEREALDFYAMNHFMALVKAKFTLNEELPEWAARVAHTYYKVLERQGTRMLFYMILITVRESRHVKTNKDEDFWVKFKKEFGESAYTFNRDIKGTHSETAAQAFMDNPPDVDVGLFSKSLTHIFFKGGFSGGYGGKPWGLISQTLDQMLNGDTSMEVMLDTAYTLAHNNGPMFNKGMLYKMYNHELYKILDVQRSGQIPEYLIEGHGSKASVDVMGCLDLVRKARPHEFGPEVNWQQVTDLGALHDYSSLIQKQKAKVPPTVKTGELITGSVMLFPGKSVNIFKRNKATA